jgi:phosphate transport system substrate-binding protein
MLGCLMLAGSGTAGAAEQALPQGRPVVDSGISPYMAKAGVSGGIAISGSDTMQPIVAKIASAFREWQPNVKIAVQGGGTGTALLQFLQNQSTIRRGDANPSGHQVSGSVALLAASRPLTEDERKDFRSRYGYDVTEIPIAMDAIAIYVNRQNPIEGLTMEQVDAIFGSDRKRGLREAIDTWGQLGLKDEWSGQPIHRYGQDIKSGTRSFFVSHALQNGAIRSDVREESGPASEILALSRDTTGIGYAGIGFKASAVKVLPLAERSGESFVVPSEETTVNGTYPLARKLYLYAKKDPKGELEPAILEFLKFVNSRQGQEMAVKAGAYPLPAHQVAQNLHVLSDATMASIVVAPSVN